MNERFVRMPELLKTLGISRGTIYLWMDKGSFPRPAKLGPNTVGWPESVVKGWIESKKEEVAYVR